MEMQERIARVEALRAAGKSTTAAAKEVGISPATYYTNRKEGGKKLPKVNFLAAEQKAPEQRVLISIPLSALPKVLALL